MKSNELSYGFRYFTFEMTLVNVSETALTHQLTLSDRSGGNVQFVQRAFFVWSHWFTFSN